MPTQRQTLFTVSVVLGSVVNVILNFLLIGKYNAIGASVATVIAEFSVTAIQCWFVRKQLPLKNIFLSAIKYLVLGAIMELRSIMLVKYLKRVFWGCLSKLSLA